MKKLLKVTAVNYLNTKPFLYGIFNTGLHEMLDLQLDIPSACAEKLERGTVDFGLIPVAAIPALEPVHIVGDYCIGSRGAVFTVCVFSDHPIERLDKIYLDYHSRTSVNLLRILLKKHWNLQPELLPAFPGFEMQIGGTTGALVIGDRAIALREKHPYIYDLGQAWHDLTSLPFVFAAWVSKRPLPAEFIARFNAALRAGVAQIPHLQYIIPPPSPGFDLEEYFTRYISYEFDAEKHRGMQFFLSEMRQLEALQPMQQAVPASLT